MKVAVKFIFCFFLGINLNYNACNSLFVPSLLSQSVSGFNFAVQFQTTTGPTCTNVIDVEIACSNVPFSGIAAAIFTTPLFAYTSVPATFPVFNISLVGFCPGSYKFRFRQRNPVNNAVSAWSSTFFFTFPGTYNPPVVYITSSTPNLCPPQSTTLTANVVVDCGITPYTYSWSPFPGVSCVTCSNTVVSPTVTTTYSVVVTGGQLGCWTQSASITIPIGPIPPVIGPASSFPTTACSGSTTIVGLSFYNGNVNWQVANAPNGPWSYNGQNGYNFTTNTLTNTTYYRAVVTGCFLTDTSNVVQVLVNPNPTITVSSPIICPGQTATITANGASSYFWPNGSFPSGANTGGAAPLTTTAYTVTGFTAGCTATALSTVSVDIVPTAVVNNQTICANTNLVLNAGGGLSYFWEGPLNYTSGLQSPVITNAIPINSGDYTLTAYSLAGCSNSVVSNILVRALIMPTLTVSSPVCFGTPTNFTATGAQSYSLFGPNGFNAYVPFPVINNTSYAESGIYTLIGSVGPCSGTTTAFINVRVPPVPSASNSSPVCDGLPLFFSGNGGVSYFWSGPSGFSSSAQNPSIAAIYLNNAGGYTLAVTGSNSCVSRTVNNVVVNPLPAIPANNFTICLNAPINLLSGGGNIYKWSGPAGFTSQLQNPVIANASYSSAGAYQVSVTTAAGCSNTAVNNVVVINIPSPIITGPSSVCVGSTLVLSGGAANSYTWSGPAGYVSSAATASVNNIAVVSQGIYTLTGQVGSCLGYTTKSVQVVPLPIFSINTNTVCDARNLSLVPSGGFSYQWFPPNGVNSQLPTYNVSIVSPANAGTYTVITTGVGGCVSKNTFSLGVLPNPTVTALGATVCAGQPAVITATGGLTYQWSGPGFLSNSQNAFIPNVNNNTTGNYVVTATALNSCTDAATVKVELIAIPIASAVATPTVCFNSTVLLQGFGGETYYWKGPYDFVSSKQTTTFVAASMGLSGTYTLSAISKSGCVGTATASVFIFAIPEGTLNSSTQQRCVPFCSDFKFVNKNNTALVSNLWRFNGQLFNSPIFSHCFTEPGNYVLFGSFADQNTCANTTSFVIIADESPRADFIYSPARPFETTDEVVFENDSKGNNINKFFWAFENNSGFKSEKENVSYYFSEAGAHPVTLVVKNSLGCADTMTKAITVEEDFSLFVPEAFTPNQDGKNETFQPKGRGVVAYHFMVHDRWGERLFETNDFSQGWDGSFRGKACKEESYQWTIRAVDKSGKVKELSGRVALYR